MSAESSKALRYVVSKGWNYRLTDSEINIEVCPYCGNSNWKFFMNFTTEKDGVHDCKVCGEAHNLYHLREYLGDGKDTIVSMQDAAKASSQPSPLPDVERLHQALMNEDGTEKDDTALDYLLEERGFTLDVVEKYKLGLNYAFDKRWISIPYFSGGQLVYVKFRSLPPSKKEFMGVKGRECPLFNSDCLSEGMDELLVVEGEADCLSCLSNGIEQVVGVPGANVKKAAWLAKLDSIEPKLVYLLYDNDKVGQDAAKKMAAKIGYDRCRNILLPEFKYTDKSDVEHVGKDINEWFKAGHTIEEFNVLKAQAKQFDVDGVANVASIVQGIKDRLAGGQSLAAKYQPRSPSIRRLVGGFEDGDLIGIMAEGKVGKTTWAQQLLDELSVDYDEPSMMYCLEMAPERSVRKWICNVTDTPDDKITEQTVDDAMNIAVSRKADYLFAYTRSTKYKDVFEVIRQAVRRYGVKFVCFDNLQILCQNIEHSTQETSVITKAFKQLALELGIVIFLIIQPHRVQEGKIISARNAHGSSAIEKDVDLMLCLHRERIAKVDGDTFAQMGFIEADENFAPELLVRADLSRFAAGGVTTLMFLGDRSRVVEMTDADRVAKTSLSAATESIERHNVVADHTEAA